MLDEAARAALLARAEALLVQRPGDGVALDVVVALDPRPAARVRALRARLTAASTPRERAQLALQLARALVDDGEARAALELAATAVAHGLPASRWLELASALRDTAVAGEVPRLLARVATHATPGEVVLPARAEAEAREHAGDLAGAYEARTRAELGSVDELAEVARLAMRLARHVEARGWLARWEARLGDDREARLRWLAASADADLAAGDADGARRAGAAARPGGGRRPARGSSAPPGPHHGDECRRGPRRRRGHARGARRRSMRASARRRPARSSRDAAPRPPARPPGRRARPT